MAKPTIIENFIPCTPRWGIRVQDEACWGYGKTLILGKIEGERRRG